MSPPLALSRHFLEHGRDAGLLLPPADLEKLLSDLYEAGSAAWPDIVLAAPAFVQHLAERRPDGDEQASFLLNLNAADLYLACACQAGQPAALAAFDSAILSRVPLFIGRIDRSPAFADEVRQLLREKLFVATASERPKIAEYSGSGALVAWARVVALRTALSQRRSQERHIGERIDEIAAQGRSSEQDLELSYLRGRHQQEFRQALKEAFSSLSRDQRNVLRLHFAGKLTGDKIAAMLQVSRATVVRWLASARSAMLHETRRLLQDRLRLSPAEFDSFIKLVRTRLEASISDLLQETSD